MSIHEPVLTAEALMHLAPERGGLFVDCTVGLGGHTRALLEAGASRVIGLDRDADALALAGAELASFGDRVELVHADYRSMAHVLADAASAPSTVHSPISACHRSSSTAKAAASASAATSRSTCGWIAAAARPQRT